MKSKPSSVTVGKKILINVGNFSNVEISHYVTIDIGEDEEPDYDAIYNEINKNLQLESDGQDPRWMKTGELKNEYKLTLKLPKRKGGE